jgi:hypothetical protein
MDWRLTATTLFCDKARRWVPVLVYKDGKTGCGYYTRQERRNGDGRQPCSGPRSCSLCAAYRDDVFQREDQRSKAKEKEWADEEKVLV